jgi:hypothetical protein
MKFLICVDGVFREELDGMANGLTTNGHHVAGFDRNIYRAFQEQNPDFLILTELSASNPEIIKFRDQNNPKTIVVNFEKIVFPDNFEMNLPSFANTMKYKPELPNKALESDVVIAFDGNNPEMVHDLYEKIHRNYRTKIIGQFINCPGFVGMGSHQDLVKLAKSAKLTISTNRTMSNSLLYNNILSVHNKENPLELLNLTAKERDAFVLAEKRNIITENKLGQVIIEKLSNFSR